MVYEVWRRPGSGGSGLELVAWYRNHPIIAWLHARVVRGEVRRFDR